MNVLCLLNHALTDSQISDLKINFGCSEIIYPPKTVSEFWSQIPADDISLKLLQPVIDWLNTASHKGDVSVIQGEFGATYALVSWCLDHGLLPVHSVTQRVAEEHKEGETVYRSYVFKHIRFRAYRTL